MSQFKVGDKVRTNIEAPRPYAGRTGKITGSTEQYGYHWFVLLDNSGDGLYAAFYSHELELIAPEPEPLADWERELLTGVDAEDFYSVYEAVVTAHGGRNPLRYQAAAVY